MKTLKDFLVNIQSCYQPRKDILLNINNKRFEIGYEMRSLMTKRERMVYAGRLLGREKRVFEPSPSLLETLSLCDGVNKIHVEKEIGWLLVCGRDVFEENFLSVEGNLKIGSSFLVITEGNCLGYGIIEKFNNELICKNLFDLGDFLRRERY